MRKLKTFLAIFICGAALFSACATSDAKTSEYVWENVTPKAAFPEGYGFPVFVMNGEMRALYGSGWTSKDGKNWTRAGLPSAGLNPGYQKYVQFKNAVYALGAVEGNYLNFRVRTKIARTRDFRSWETVAEKSNLPERIFYGALAFKDKIWLFGGWDGARYYNDVWNSEDGVVWKRVAETAAWSPRTAGGVVFKDKIWLIGGGVIDGDKADNPHAHREVWTSADGVDWTREKINSPVTLSGSAVVFDDRLWLVGANRNDGDFSNAVLVSEDGIDWQRQSAPWSPRGAAAVWVFDDRLFMTGGKFSYQENGKVRFVYSNDVWALRKAIKN